MCDDIVQLTPPLVAAEDANSSAFSMDGVDDFYEVFKTFSHAHFALISALFVDSGIAQ